MGKFFKYFFATLLGTFFGIILLIAIVVGIVFISSSKTISTVDYKDKNVLVIKNTVSIGEISTPSMPTLVSTFDTETKYGLYDILCTLEQAANDDKISGIVLDDVIVDAGYSTVQEFAEALQKFRQSGKFVVAHFTMLSQKSYLLASVCDEITMNAEGMAEFHGITSSSVHYKDLLEKIGMKPVVVRCGKYKSYVESVTSDKMSAENREQRQAYINGVWESYAKSLDQYKNIGKSTLDTLADNVLVCRPDELLKFGLIDTIVFNDEFWNIVKDKMEISYSDSISKISFRSYMDDLIANTQVTPKKKSPVALILAQGGIDMGKSDENSIGSDTYVKQFQTVRKDSSIRSVVFRINSGGGSALASELIWREVALTAEVKPVIVSMGDMAASGGYYIASPATKIVACPSSLTGSIGVFGMSITAEKLLDKVGVSFDKVNTHSHSDFGNISRDMDPVELHAIEKTIDQTYATFKRRVSDGRNLSVDSVEAIAQGRIWGGYDALANGLVDTLGGLATALRIAAAEAGLSADEAYAAQVFPKQKTLLEMLYDRFDIQSSIAEKLAEQTELKHCLNMVPKQSGTYAQLPYSLLIE